MVTFPVAKYPDEIHPGQVDFRQIEAGCHDDPPPDDDEELSDDDKEVNAAAAAPATETITELPKTPEKQEPLVPAPDESAASTAVPAVSADVSEESASTTQVPQQEPPPAPAQTEDTPPEGKPQITKLDDKSSASSADRVNLPDVVPEMAAFPTPTPSDHGSDLVERDLAKNKQRNQNASAGRQKKSPTKRRNNTAFKCACGAKKCRGYFYCN